MLVGIHNVPDIILYIKWESPWIATCSYKNSGLQIERSGLPLSSLKPQTRYLSSQVLIIFIHPSIC